MRAVRFTLSSLGATFKRPYINTINLTYSHIHKVALLGILGAILGLKGHRQKDKDDAYPEFYEKLRRMKVAIVPYGDGVFPKNNVAFTNTTGFANQGETLIVKEQSLVEPKWDIYLAQCDVDDEVFNKIVRMLEHHECVFDPYLGKTHFPAEFNGVEVIEIEEAKGSFSMDSLFPTERFNTEMTGDPEKDEYFYTEIMPVAFTPHLNHYREEEFAWGNCMVEPKQGTTGVYRDGERVICLF